MACPQRVSIVIEWENVAASAAGRVVRVLSVLSQQVGELAAAARRGRLPLAVAMPVEILVLFDSQDTAAADVEHAVSSGLGDSPFIDLRIIPAPGLEYFEMKNYGARQSRGDLIVFLDSDVIPQPHWLVNLLGSFADPDVHAVASRAFVKPDSLYAKTVALTWLFPPPSDEAKLTPSWHFHANGAAFRREVILQHPYSPTPGQLRGAGYDLLIHLRSADITVYEQGAALLDHPPPLGALGYLLRGFTQGNDDYLGTLCRHGPQNVTLRRSVRRVSRKWRAAVANLWRERRLVGLSLQALPAAIAISSAYYAAYGAGHISARFRTTADVEGSATESPEVVSLRFPMHVEKNEPAKPRRRKAA